MAARDILSLDTSMAARLIRCLYIVALILIAIMIVFGVVRGVRVMGRAPTLPPAMTDNGAPNAAAPSADAPPSAEAPQALRPGMMGPRGMMGRRFMMERRMGMMGRPGPFGMGRNPAVAGAFLILGALLRGVIALMVVRILAEIGLAILAMGKRAAT